MNKTIYTVSILAAALLTLSCQKESKYLPANVLKATAETVGDAQTRTQMAYGFDVLWNEGDQICVKNNTTSATYTLQEGAGTTDGTFTCSTSPFTSGSQVEAFYPQSLVGNGKLTWPAELSKGFVMPMYCKRTLAAGDAQKLNFKSLGGILQIAFMKNMQVYPIIKYVKVEDGSKTLSGAFTVDAEGKAVITATDKAGIRLETGMEKALGWGAGIINVALPAGTYNSLKLTFTDQDGKALEREIGESVTIVQNGITRLVVLGGTFKDISQSTGAALANIDGGEMYVSWIRLWFNGPKFAKYNIGAVGEIGSAGRYYNWGAMKYRDEDRNFDHSSSSTKLTGSDDTATALWGRYWRMPTKTELEGLINNCNYQYINENGQEGILFTSKNADYVDNSIFIPYSGYYTDSNIGPMIGAEAAGFLWSSEPSGSDAYALEVNYTKSQGYYLKVENSSRSKGMPIRPVLAE